MFTPVRQYFGVLPEHLPTWHTWVSQWTHENRNILGVIAFHFIWGNCTAFGRVDTVSSVYLYLISLGQLQQPQRIKTALMGFKHTWNKKIFGFPARDGHLSPRYLSTSCFIGMMPSVPYKVPLSPWLKIANKKQSVLVWSSCANFFVI